MKITYPEEFKTKMFKYQDEVIDHYKDRGRFYEWLACQAKTSLIQSLANGDINLGSTLLEKASTTFTPEKIVEAYQDQAAMNELYFEAVTAIKCGELYQEWNKLYQDAQLEASKNSRNK